MKIRGSFKFNTVQELW